MRLLEVLYILVSGLLALYGLNSLYLVWRRRAAIHPEAPPPPSEWPRVTVQLPVYNELHTIDRLLEAVSALEYPRERLQVQVLDDSTDGTSDRIRAWLFQARHMGLNADHLQRQTRSGYKAGALAAGLHSARGEFVAIFDADFVPPSDFLLRALPWFADERDGCVQARWTHLNRDYSSLTRVQALGVDGHFVVEQAARAASGLFLNFNGTAGVWRRRCIEDAGGWRADTLTEDLDLSYRAQLRGWRIRYAPDVAVPAELPVQMAAYKHQQARWAQGSLQTARRLLLPLWRSDQPLGVKLHGTLHLTAYLVHPLMLSAFLLAVPLSGVQSPVLRWGSLLMLAALGPPLMYLTAASADGPSRRERLKLIPGLLMVGIGLSLNNTRAALAGLLSGAGGTFQRTPKFGLRQRGQAWRHSGYVLPGDPWTWGEVALGLMALCLLGWAPVARDWGFVPWLIAYASGFLYVAGVGIGQHARLRRPS